MLIKLKRILKQISGVVQIRGDSRVIILTNNQINTVKGALYLTAAERPEYKSKVFDALLALDKPLNNPLQHLTDHELVALASERISKL